MRGASLKLRHANARAQAKVARARAWVCRGLATPCTGVDYAPINFMPPPQPPRQWWGMMKKGGGIFSMGCCLPLSINEFIKVIVPKIWGITAQMGII